MPLVFRAALTLLRRLFGARPSAQLYTDGSGTDGRGRPGGWAWVLVQAGEAVASDAGREAATTSHAMEVRAATEGFRFLQQHGWHLRAEVEWVTDSRLTLDIAQGAELPRKDQPASLALKAAFDALAVRGRWTRGHSGDRWNEHVDALARAARDQAPTRSHATG